MWPLQNQATSPHFREILFPEDFRQSQVSTKFQVTEAVQRHRGQGGQQVIG